MVKLIRWPVSLGSSVISAWLLSLLFAFTSIDKLIHYDGFAKALDSYVILSPGFAHFLAMPIILAEAWLAVGLLLPRQRRTASMCSLVLLTFFTMALLFNRYFKPDAPCGCWFTLTLGTGTTFHVLQNLVLIGLSLTIWWDKGQQHPAAAQHLPET